MLCNKNKTGVIFKTHLLCLSSNFLLDEVFRKKETILAFEHYVLEERCAVVKSNLV